jgi:hypothetical protein
MAHGADGPPGESRRPGPYLYELPGQPPNPGKNRSRFHSCQILVVIEHQIDRMKPFALKE